MLQTPDWEQSPSLGNEACFEKRRWEEGEFARVCNPVADGTILSCYVMNSLYSVRRHCLYKKRRQRFKKPTTMERFTVSARTSHCQAERTYASDRQDTIKTDHTKMFLKQRDTQMSSVARSSNTFACCFSSEMITSR